MMILCCRLTVVVVVWKRVAWRLFSFQYIFLLLCFIMRLEHDKSLIAIVAELHVSWLKLVPLLWRSETLCALINVQLLCVGVQTALTMGGSQDWPTDEHPGPFSQARFSAQTQWENLILVSHVDAQRRACSPVRVSADTK